MSTDKILTDALRQIKGSVIVHKPREFPGTEKEPVHVKYGKSHYGETNKGIPHFGTWIKDHNVHINPDGSLIITPEGKFIEGKMTPQIKAALVILRAQTGKKMQKSAADMKLISHTPAKKDATESVKLPDPKRKLSEDWRESWFRHADSETADAAVKKWLPKTPAVKGTQYTTPSALKSAYAFTSTPEAYQKQLEIQKMFRETAGDKYGKFYTEPEIADKPLVMDTTKLTPEELAHYTKKYGWAKGPGGTYDRLTGSTWLRPDLLKTKWGQETNDKLNRTSTELHEGYAGHKAQGLSTLAPFWDAVTFKGYPTQDKLRANLEKAKGADLTDDDKYRTSRIEMEPRLRVLRLSNAGRGYFAENQGDAKDHLKAIVDGYTPKGLDSEAQWLRSLIPENLQGEQRDQYIEKLLENMAPLYQGAQVLPAQNNIAKTASLHTMIEKKADALDAAANAVKLPSTTVQQNAKNTSMAPYWTKGYTKWVDPWVPSELSAKQLIHGWKEATKGGFNFQGKPFSVTDDIAKQYEFGPAAMKYFKNHGVLDAQRARAAEMAPKLQKAFKDAGLNVFRGRVKAPTSIMPKISSGELPLGQIPDDLLGFQMYAKDPAQYKKIVDILHQQGAKGFDVNLFNAKPYKGINISTNMHGTPLELQLSPSKFKNATALAGHDGGLYLPEKNLPHLKKGDAATLRTFNKAVSKPTNEFWKTAPNAKLKTTDAQGNFKNPFEAAVKNEPLPVLKNKPTGYAQKLKDITDPGRSGKILRKLTPYMMWAQAASGAADPDTAIENSKDYWYQQKHGPRAPGWNEDSSWWMKDPSTVFGGNTPERQMKYNELLRDRANRSLWGTAVGPIGEMWNSFHLGRLGGVANQVLSAPATAGAFIAKPLWDEAKKPTGPASDYDVNMALHRINKGRKAEGKAPIGTPRGFSDIKLPPKSPVGFYNTAPQPRAVGAPVIYPTDMRSDLRELIK